MNKIARRERALSGPSNVWEPPQDILIRRLQLHNGHAFAEANMRTISEREMFVGILAFNIKRVGVLKF